MPYPRIVITKQNHTVQLTTAKSSRVHSLQLALYEEWDDFPSYQKTSFNVTHLVSNFKIALPELICL